MKKAPTRRGDLRYWLVLAGLFWMRPEAWSTGAGTVLIVGAALLHLWAKGCLRMNVQVTTWGPYAWVRHPFYLANWMADMGVLLLSGNPVLAACAAPLWAWVYARTILREEAGLVAMLGEDYKAYRRRVPALLPWRGRVGGASGGFSWDNPNLSEGREWARVLRLLAYPALFLWVERLRGGDWLGSESLASAALAGLLHLAALGIVWNRRARRAALVPVR